MCKLVALLASSLCSLIAWRKMVVCRDVLTVTHIFSLASLYLFLVFLNFYLSIVEIHMHAPWLPCDLAHMHCNVRLGCWGTSAESGGLFP